MVERNDLELRRLENLYSYQILDSEEESNFDKLTKVASEICGTPISLISLVDKNRQWFKSHHGVSATETPRSISFCSLAIEGTGVFEVTDATRDNRFKTNPLVTGDPNIRFYAGALLTSPEGYNLGTLCVIDRQEKKLTESQKEALQALADQAVELLLLRRTNRQLKEAKKILEEHQELVVNKTRVQSIGELAGGICHQVNNPLAIIVGRAMILKSQLQSKFTDDHEVFRDLDIIDQAAFRISEIMKALRSYAKDLGNEVGTFTIQSIVEDALLLTRSRPNGLRVNVNFGRGEEAIVLVNKNQITQIIIDLLSNSFEAVEGPFEKSVGITIERDGERVLVAITDTGPGIHPTEAEKIFEPFFSTKPRHFGVGLSNARNFAKQNQGELFLDKTSNPTTIVLSLPISA